MNIKKTVLWITLSLLFCPFGVFVYAQTVHTDSITLAPRVAPGERIPLAVKLSNFGSGSRVDVTVHYTIENSVGQTVTELSETVAVETTASYIQQVPLPPSTPPGQYIARVQILYNDQLVPATATYQFTVEKKMFGFFVTDMVQYGGMALFVCSTLLLLAFFLFGRRAHKTLFDYSHVPREVRVYYEIVSDTIQQMRLHKGNDAIDLAATIPGLVIEKNTGRVVDIAGDPSDTIALLVDAYEHSFGKKVNLSLGTNESRAIVR